MPDKVTAPRLKAMKARGERIVCVTVYDALMASLVDESGIDVALVGDSLGNVFQGQATTLPVELGDIVYHLRAVRRGIQRALLIADLPFGSYHVSVEQTLESAILLMKNGADAVKLEGDYPDRIAALVQAGIPVMGHLGFTPQAVHAFGGFRVQGRGEAGDQVLEQAVRLDQAGAFGIVLELIPAELAGRITTAITCPTIGIGAGVDCDGEIQVLPDILGLSERVHKHTRAYISGRADTLTALQAYAKDVRAREFPTSEQSF